MSEPIKAKEEQAGPLSRPKMGRSMSEPTEPKAEVIYVSKCSTGLDAHIHGLGPSAALAISPA